MHFDFVFVLAGLFLPKKTTQSAIKKFSIFFGIWPEIENYWFWAFFGGGEKIFFAVKIFLSRFFSVLGSATTGKGIKKA